MANQSLYHLDCICGTHIATADTVTRCPKCGRELHTQWQAPYKPTADTKLVKEELPHGPEDGN